MKFGKLPNIDLVDFTLPPNDPRTLPFLKSLPKREGEPKVYVGCTGWSMKEWVGKVYPPGTKAKDYLHYYSRQFNTIEFNTTHYRTPDDKTIAKWKNESGPGFRFCPKILQAISHSRNPGQDADLLNRFCAGIYGLGEKLGCSFMQLPPYFDKSRLPALIRFLNQWPKEIPIAIEVRHESWFADQKSKDALFSAFEANGIATVITDVAGRRDVLHQRLTSGTAMIRFVGNALHPTDYARIDSWVERLANWFDNGLNEVYFFPHEPDNLLAPDLVVYFVSKINQKLGLNNHAPTLSGAMPDENAPGQIMLF